MKAQVIREFCISTFLGDTIWINKNLKECKVRIYKTSEKPVLTYTAAIRGNTMKTHKRHPWENTTSQSQKR